MTLEHIKKHFDFVKIKDTNTKAFTHSFVLQIRPNDKGITRVGFTVSKRIAKHAVVRNRLRRQMREIVRLCHKLQELYPSHDLVLIARSEALNRTYQQLSDDFNYLLTHVKDTSDESDKNNR